MDSPLWPAFIETQIRIDHKPMGEFSELQFTMQN